MGHITIANRNVNGAIKTANFLREQVKVIA